MKVSELLDTMDVSTYVQITPLGDDGGMLTDGGKVQQIGDISLYQYRTKYRFWDVFNAVIVSNAKVDGDKSGIKVPCLCIFCNKGE